MITCSFILLSYAPFSFLCNHPSRPTFFGNSFLLSIGCICRNWQGCTSFTSYKNITLLLRLTKRSILTLSSDHKGISSVRHINNFFWETCNTVIIKWWLISIHSDFSENNFSCWIRCIGSWKEALAQLAHLPPSFDWVAPYHLETCHSSHYNEFIHSLYHAILYMQNLDRTMWVAGGIGGGSRRWYKWVSPATVSKHIVHPSCKKYAYTKAGVVTKNSK